MHKLSHRPAEGWVPHSFEAIYTVAQMGEGERISAGIPSGNSSAFVRLVSCLEPPYLLLYVLHTPRGEAAAGRYQSPPIQMQDLSEFIARFGAFLCADARFDIWAHSPSERATVAWDRHNQIFAYGPLERFVLELKALGFVEGEASVSFAHAHHYRQEFDEDARELLKAFNWSYSELRAEDKQ